MTAAFCALLLGAAPAGAAEVPANLPAHVGRHTTSPEDQRELAQVAADFQAAIKTKNIRQLASLMLNTDIPFVSPAPPRGIKKAREMIDPNANGLHAGGFHDFAQFIRESKVPVEERFYNVKITQDKNVAWVMFDYEFVEDGKVGNYGIETWQMMQNVEGKWKIASVWWTYNPMQ
jgi:hypothetical protein